LFARFLAENDLLVEPDSGMALSLDECRELAREQSKDWLVLASDFAQRMLPQIFRAGDPVLEVALPPEKRQELEAILEALPHEVFIADDSLGWVYQFWQSDQKDTVNKSENKIGADELPAVTQLFTEDYMVLFLLHNTLGAWWAGKVLAAKARPRPVGNVGGRPSRRVRGARHRVELPALRARGRRLAKPAAGTFPGWPTVAKDLTVLDPCMGSGHFLAFALPMLVALRRQEEKLSVAEAVDAVLRDNLFGLELDPRCTQIAAFNVGLTAWKLAGYRPLPAMNLACAGLAINAPVTAWTALAAGDALAENAMKQLYELFRQAPTLGSLIDPTRVGGELFVANFDKIRGLLASALASEASEDAELAVVAQGIAKAASLLAHRYTLVATNVPYLGRGKQVEVLRDYCERLHPDAKSDLATSFLNRCLRFAVVNGSTALVAPQHWWFLGSYRSLRKHLLLTSRVDVLAALGEEAWQSFGDRGPVACLFIATNTPPKEDSSMCGIDALPEKTIAAKIAMLQSGTINVIQQKAQFDSPDHRITIDEPVSGTLLSAYAESFQGVSPADAPRFSRFYWEITVSDTWRWWQSAPNATKPFGGRSLVLWWSADLEAAFESGHAYLRGESAWGRWGVAVRQMRELSSTLYSGEVFDTNTAVIVPRDPDHILAIWAFCSSPEFQHAVRRIDKKVNVTNASMVKIPFDVSKWTNVASRDFPALPTPAIDDATQWLFAGHPLGASSPLQVAVSRLVGYRWPRQTGSSFPEASSLAVDELGGLADDDGIVCLTALRGEAPAADRVRALLAKAYGTSWSSETLTELLGGVGSPSLEDWLRNGFFSQHCDLFEQRPFVWHVWDGLANGFGALLNYHQLAAPNGEGRRVLDKLTHTYLGDWLDRQRADQKAGVEGADGRVAAAEHLKRELEKILEGEPPYDIFVRWRPLHRQPVGWEPDIDDGVRVNIRPFMTAKPLNAREEERLHSARGPEDQMGQGPWQGADPREERLPMVLGLGR
jgi:hypothetical protein